MFPECSYFRDREYIESIKQQFADAFKKTIKTAQQSILNNAFTCTEPWYVLPEMPATNLYCPICRELVKTYGCRMVLEKNQARIQCYNLNFNPVDRFKSQEEKKMNPIG